MGAPFNGASICSISNAIIQNALLYKTPRGLREVEAQGRAQTGALLRQQGLLEQLQESLAQDDARADFERLMVQIHEAVEHEAPRRGAVLPSTE